MKLFKILLFIVTVIYVLIYFSQLFGYFLTMYKISPIEYHLLLVAAFLLIQIE